MKTQIYIEDGITQIILTAENDFEQSVIDKLSKANNMPKIKMFNGEFGLCKGGYVRVFEKFNTNYLNGDKNTNGFILILNEKSK